MDTITAASPAPEPQPEQSYEDFAATYSTQYRTALCATAVALRSAGAILPSR